VLEHTKLEAEAFSFVGSDVYLRFPQFAHRTRTYHLRVIGIGRGKGWAKGKAWYPVPSFEIGRINTSLIATEVNSPIFRLRRISVFDEWPIVHEAGLLLLPTIKHGLET
jgi:hypothetical protein